MTTQLKSALWAPHQKQILRYVDDYITFLYAEREKDSFTDQYLNVFEESARISSFISEMPLERNLVLRCHRKPG